MQRAIVGIFSHSKQTKIATLLDLALINSISERCFFSVISTNASNKALDTYHYSSLFWFEHNIKVQEYDVTFFSKQVFVVFSHNTSLPFFLSLSDDPIVTKLDNKNNILPLKYNILSSVIAIGFTLILIDKRSGISSIRIWIV